MNIKNLTDQYNKVVMKKKPKGVVNDATSKQPPNKV